MTIPKSREHLIQTVISMLKKDSSYKVSSNYTTKESYKILLYRGIQILRGIRIRIKLKSSRGFMFCGKSVTIEHGYMVEVYERKGAAVESKGLLILIFSK